MYPSPSLGELSVLRKQLRIKLRFPIGYRPPASGQVI